MSSIEDRYYKINRILLKAFGIWPFQNSKWTHIQALIITSIYISGLFVQLAVFITHECTLKIVVDVLSFVFPTIFMLFIYDSFYVYGNDFKKILERIYHDWKLLKSEEELIIMNDYASTAKLLTQISLCSYGIFMPIMSHAVPMTLDVVVPLNESRAQDLHALVEYFVDPSEHYALLVIHLILFICLGSITSMGTSLLLMSIGYHACALFKLANYEMELIMDQNILHIPSPKREQLVHKRMIYAVDVHRRALEFCELLMENIKTGIFFAMVVGVISFSINLLRLLQAMADLKIKNVFIPTILILIHFCYLFFGNHIGQLLTDNNDDCFKTIYKLPWYKTSLNMQKLFLFLLQRGSKSLYLSISGLFDASYQGFKSLTTTSISYFTVLYSVQ